MPIANVCAFNKLKPILASRSGIVSSKCASSLQRTFVFYFINENCVLTEEQSKSLDVYSRIANPSCLAFDSESATWLMRSSTGEPTCDQWPPWFASGGLLSLLGTVCRACRWISHQHIRDLSIEQHFTSPRASTASVVKTGVRVPVQRHQ